MVCWASTSHFIGLIRQEKQQQSSCWCRLLLKSALNQMSTAKSNICLQSTALQCS